MITTILSIFGAVGGIAGLISLAKFVLTSKSYKKQTEEEADSVAIKNLKESINVLKETMSSQKQEIADLQNKIKTLESDILKSSIDLKSCFKDRFDLEEYSEKLQSALDISGICEHIINGYNCPVIERYKKLFPEIPIPNDKTSS